MDCSWSEAVRLAGWEFARPDSQRVLAFVYAATVSLRVEESCVSINPFVSIKDLERVLTRAPDWVEGRREWLKEEWPSKQVQRLSDLEQYGLTASKALLAFGAKIPDGNQKEMRDALASLFPEITSALQRNSESYEAWGAHVTIETDGNRGWGFALAREGHPFPMRDANIGNRSAFEVFLQNQMRIDIQGRIEALIS